MSGRIPDDKVAETIGAYLCAHDEQGKEVRRPARRGVAYRMLKEFGNGNVFLALRDVYREFRVGAGGTCRAPWRCVGWLGIGRAGYGLTSGAV